MEDGWITVPSSDIAALLFYEQEGETCLAVQYKRRNGGTQTYYYRGVDDHIRHAILNAEISNQAGDPSVGATAYHYLNRTRQYRSISVDTP